MRYEKLTIEGRNTVLGAFRFGKTIDKPFALDGCQDGSVRTIVQEAKGYDTIVNYMTRECLGQVSETGEYQGAITPAAAYKYAEVGDMLKAAEEKGEPPFLILLDGVGDPHNLEAIIETANLAGAHGVIIPEHRAVRLTAVAARASVGALSYTPIAKATNLMTAMEGLRKKGMWFVYADVSGEVMYKVNLEGPTGLVTGSKREGVGGLVSEHCDMTAPIPTKGDIGSLNASMVAGVLAYETVRQRVMAQYQDGLQIYA